MQGVVAVTSKAQGLSQQKQQQQQKLLLLSLLLLLLLRSLTSSLTHSLDTSSH